VGRWCVSRGGGGVKTARLGLRIVFGQTGAQGAYKQVRREHTNRCAGSIHRGNLAH
jgi:hypothetical protein